jgi:hypothetical protein
MFCLRGRENYYPWLARWKNQCYIEGWLLQDGTYSTDAKKVKEMKNWLNTNIADSAIFEFDASKDVQDAMTDLEVAFGSGYDNY